LRPPLTAGSGSPASVFSSSPLNGCKGRLHHFSRKSDAIPNFFSILTIISQHHVFSGILSSICLFFLVRRTQLSVGGVIGALISRSHLFGSSAIAREAGTQDYTSISYCSLVTMQDGGFPFGFSFVEHGMFELFCTVHISLFIFLSGESQAFNWDLLHI
jgi:hypothetical protein